MSLLAMYDIFSGSFLKTISRQKVKKYSTRKDSGARIRLRQPSRQLLISYQILDRDTAREEIREFIRNNPRCTTS